MLILVVCLQIVTGKECEDPTLCKNGGTCLRTHTTDFCMCEMPWTGARCENLDINLLRIMLTDQDMYGVKTKPQLQHWVGC